MQDRVRTVAPQFQLMSSLFEIGVTNGDGDSGIGFSYDIEVYEKGRQQEPCLQGRFNFKPRALGTKHCII